MQRLLSDLQGHPQAWAFLQPVNGEEVEDYYDVIKRPMGSSCSTPPYPNISHALSTRLEHHGAQARDEPVLFAEGLHR